MNQLRKIKYYFSILYIFDTKHMRIILLKFWLSLKNSIVSFFELFKNKIFFNFL